MSSRDQQKLHEKLQYLRSITNSNAVNNTSIIVDASKYIEDLKDKVDRLNLETATSSRHQISSTCDPDDSSLPRVTVEYSLEKGVMVNVFANKSCPGLLVDVLEAFEELNLTVFEARVSCTDSFILEALVEQVLEQNEEQEEEESTSIEVVRQAVEQAVKQWADRNGDDQQQRT